MEVGSTAHYMMGGIRVDSDSQMSMAPGLFAAGECAGGLNGANRLGGNSLSGLLVFGKLAGEHAARFAIENRFGTINSDEVEKAAQQALEPFEHTRPSESPYTVQRDLQETMQELAGIVRTGEELNQALEAIEKLERRAATVEVAGNRIYNPAWHTALDLRHQLTVCEAICRAALIRKESRGAHYRTDYSEKDPALSGVNSVIFKKPDGAMGVRWQPIPEMPAELKLIIEDNQ